MKRWLAIWSVGSKVLDCIAHLVVGESCTLKVTVFGQDYSITVVRIPRDDG